MTPETPPRRGGRPLVLIVEDNPPMNRYVAECLDGEFQTVSASDGEEGLRMARELHPDLIVTDVMMPVMGGEELLAALQEEHHLEHIPVVVITARDDAELRVGLLRAGAMDILAKPFSPDEVVARVRNLVTTKRAKDLLQSELRSQRSNLEELAGELARRRQEAEQARAAADSARDQAERARLAQSNFLRIMSHELRTPLQAIELQVWSLDRALQNMQSAQAAQPAGEAPEPRTSAGVAQAHRQLENLKRLYRRLADLVETVVAYARITGGRLQVRREPSDLVAIAREAVGEYREHAHRKGLDIALSCSDGIPPVESDPRLLRLVALNLVGNAVRFSEQGEVLVQVHHGRDGHLLRVHDTGPDIPEEQHGELFEPFTQLAAQSSLQGTGSGLGLGIVKTLVDALSGRITLDSEPGQGSTLTVTLPPGGEAHEESSAE